MSFFAKTKTELLYNLGKKVSVIIKLKRSYSEGKIKLFFDDGSELILGGEGSQSNIKIMRNKYGQCYGFSLNDKIHKISPIESDLMGYVHKEDDIVTMMLKIKRVGLRRLILDVYNNVTRLGIEDANYDTKLFKIN